MTDQHSDPSAKTPTETAIEHAVEALVYAPIGLLFEGASLLPELVEKGRNQVTMARMLGRFAVEQGQKEAGKAASKLQDQAAGVLELIGGGLGQLAQREGPVEDLAPTRPVAASRPLKKAPGAARAAARKVAGATSPPTPAATTQVAADRAPTTTVTAPAAAPAPSTSLAIPDYDSLSASHVVNRLAGLSDEELEAVRRYETSHRGRKTILSKVAQLQST